MTIKFFFFITSCSNKNKGQNKFLYIFYFYETCPLSCTLAVTQTKLFPTQRIFHGLPRHAAVYLKMHVRYIEVNANQSRYVMPPDVSEWIFEDLQKKKKKKKKYSISMHGNFCSLTMCPSLATQSVCLLLSSRPS